MSDAPTFDLIDEPWIPCLDRDGRPVELGLRAVLARAVHLREIADPSPLVTVALHRLLLAVLHRNVGPARMEDWHALWSAGAFPIDDIERYLDAHRGVFDLFHTERPFYQTAEVPVRDKYLKPIAELAHELQLGTPPVLFQQVRDDFAVSPARAARIVVAMQAFAMGGLIGFAGEDGETATPHKYSKDGPLKKGAVVLAKGQTLFETLLLNLVRYDGSDGAPWTFDPDDDSPAWERAEPARSRERDPAGYLDLLTWQSRRIRLVPEWAGDAVVVRRAILMRGEGFGERWNETHEPMVAFRAAANAKANAPTPWLTISFDPDRAFWRNSLALYQSLDAHTRRPKVADWIAALASDGWLPEERRFAFDVLGMSTNQAKINLWRHERFPLPLALLERERNAVAIARALDAAEEIARRLRTGFDTLPGDGKKKVSAPRPMLLFADALLRPADDQKADPAAAAALVDALQLQERYWSRLETPFRAFLITLPDEDAGALANWLDAVEATATDAFEETMRDFDQSARQLKAEALARGRFFAALREALTPYRQAVALLREVA